MHIATKPHDLYLKPINPIIIIKYRVNAYGIRHRFRRTLLRRGGQRGSKIIRSSLPEETRWKCNENRRSN